MLLPANIPHNHRRAVTTEHIGLKDAGILKLIEAGDAIGKALGSDRFEWQTAKIFLTICKHGGEIPMQQVEKLTGWGQSSVSRHMAKLGQGITIREPGAQLVETFEDPEWRRRKIVRLTSLGRKLHDQLAAIVTT